MDESDAPQPSPRGPNSPPDYPDQPRPPQWTWDGSGANANTLPHWVPYPHPWLR